MGSSNKNAVKSSSNPDDNMAILSMRMDAERLKIESLEKLQKVWWDVEEMKFQGELDRKSSKGQNSSMIDFEGALRLSNRMIESVNGLHDHEKFQECVNLSAENKRGRPKRPDSSKFSGKLSQDKCVIFTQTWNTWLAIRQLSQTPGP